MGKIRKNNEDNFCCAGNIREDIYSVEQTALSGEVSSNSNELFAVFDGMGGEALGEIASFVAASQAKRFLSEKENCDEYLYELSSLLNDKVAEETEERSLVLMGTTAAMIQFSPDSVYALNAGDSRIYRFSDHKLKKISRDHTARGYSTNALVKFLGMPNREEPLNPYIAEGKYKAGDMYLLCTDGVTDMLSDDEIESILDSKGTTEELCAELISAALEKGGRDNATAILCRIKQDIFHRQR